MQLHWIDWSIVAVLLFVVTLAGLYTRKYSVSVADFLAANRCAKRYLISVAQGIAGVGAISIIAGFEMYFKAGFTAAWWQIMGVATTTLIFLSGWVFYRFRQTRAMTMAQFFEIRYSKRFRVFMGLLAFFSGIINFGIFPAVGSRFFIYFCGLPDTMLFYAAVMALLIGFALFFTFIGGQIAVMVTDFVQGAFTNIMVVIILLTVLFTFNWSHIYEALTMAPPDASLIHPFETKDAQDFNIWYYLIMAFMLLYGTGAWQGSQGYNAAALNAHEARMGKILSTWRIMPNYLFMMIVPICAYTFLNHPDFANGASAARSLIDNIADPQIRTQMTTTVALKLMLPRGVIGGMAAVMLCAFIGNCDTYLHSWGSIFVQDVILPFRKKPFLPQDHLRLLRFAIFGVAVFIFLFSLLFRQTEYIYMFFMITGAIFMGGAGIVVSGGLYWKRGTAAAAWSAMITGSALSVTAVIIKQIQASFPFTDNVMKYIATRNGAVLSFYASIIAIFVYIIVSLIDKRQKFDLDKMLHRGIYAVEDNQKKAGASVRGFNALIGITDEFTRRDRLLYVITMGWTFLWIIIFVLGTAYNFIFDVTVESWMRFWIYYTGITLVISVITVIWFTIGGIIDIRDMYGLLNKIKRNDLDDGTVIGHHNLDEEKMQCSR